MVISAQQLAYAVEQVAEAIRALTDLYARAGGAPDLAWAARTTDFRAESDTNQLMAPQPAYLR